jgi:stage II sporulation protein P
MLALGRELADLLNGKGIPTLHCTVDHTGDGGSVQGAYERSAESVKGYLKQYPSIQLVIDLHRDAVLTSEGAYVRSAARGEEQTAQVMAVVGSDANGTACNWEGNFALAMLLRQKLNQSCEGIARPVYLRRSSFNQELAPYSLLLEIGTGANTLEEAKRTVQRVGDALAEIIRFN